MLRLVAQEGSLTAEEASAVVSLAVDEFRRLGGTHNLIVAREFAALTTVEERLALLRCLFAVSAADQSVAVREDNEIRQISRELKIEHADFISARAEVRNHLAVLNRAVLTPLRGGSFDRGDDRASCGPRAAITDRRSNCESRTLAEVARRARIRGARGIGWTRHSAHPRRRSARVCAAAGRRR